MQKIGIALMTFGVAIGFAEIALHVFADYEELPLYWFAAAFTVVGALVYGFAGQREQRRERQR